MQWNGPALALLIYVHRVSILHASTHMLHAFKHTSVISFFKNDGVYREG